MILAVVLFYLLCPTKGDTVRFKCSERTLNTSDWQFTPAKDNVSGRYTVKLCTVRDPQVKSWNIDLFYFNDTMKCPHMKKPDYMHSVLKEEIPPLDCPHVCYEADFDLIFSGCYNIHSTFETDTRRRRPTDTFFTVLNNLTLNMYRINRPHVSFLPHPNGVTLDWYLGIPATYYNVTVGLLNNKTNELVNPAKDVTENCTVGLEKYNEVKCELTLKPGYYLANFHHYALWSPLLNEQTEISYKFNYTMVESPEVSVRSTFIFWVCGGALVATAALFAAAMLQKSLRTNNYHKHVLDTWLIRSRDVETPRPVEPRPNILLLYAREGEHGQRAVNALKTLLQQVTGAQVLDLFSPEVCALSAPEPGAWLRHTLLSSNTSVVLLQSPATQALFATNMNQNNLNLQEPLLGRRAMYRSPHQNDQLLLLALRLISEIVSEHHDYKKYYIATYSKLESEIVQQVVPFRRYKLPAAAHTLLADLALHTRAADAPHAPHAPHAAEPEPALLQHYLDSVERFVQHVSDNPDYLMDELMIMY